ncbi:hypothetical protein Cgig2_022269 [Carnegiea gigantea]|uniref:Large ribosomal subunit protein bL12 C-terminal domain-containing protein n=1 Tax=Carnegiea gigantea TaxID=171969 RepID=A0A9Q1QHM3_9CARY|nr:hypothetical protein Cgig2_022269 [Carnegiea gigantea]
MRSIITKIPSKCLLRRLISSPSPISLFSHSFSTETTRIQKLERIADELMSLNPIELHNYTILFRLKMGLKNSASASLSAGLDASAGGQPGGDGGADAKAAEKTAFDVKLEKFDAAAKIKIIKEVRSFTDLGLKEAKDLVEKSPIVVKKGVTKEEGDSIVEKLKQLGATVIDP